MTGSALMLTALYMVLPVQRVTFRPALTGGAAATALREIVRHVLVYYFQKLSLVNLVYGSLATAIIVLVTLETAALILLFGAQLIAGLERRAIRRWSPRSSANAATQRPRRRTGPCRRRASRSRGPQAPSR
jgi:uncharacterized BrkB/YihY/UPF0761 family membrane protein